MINILGEKNMAKKLLKLEIVQQKAEFNVKKTNKKIEELGQQTNGLYTSLSSIQT